jgi:hypothetical protein
MTARPPEDSERGYPGYGDSSAPTGQYAYGEYGQQYAGMPDPYAAPVGQYADPAAQYADATVQYADPAAQYADPAAQYADPAAQYADPAGAAPPYGGQPGQYDPPAQYADPSAPPPQAADRVRPGKDSARPPRGRLASARPAGEPGFLGSLFDFNFASFVTPKIIKSVYLLAVLTLGVSAIAFISNGFGLNVPFGVVTRVILAALYFFLSLASFRMVLEFFMVVFRMAEDLHDVRERGGSGSR